MFTTYTKDTEIYKIQQDVSDSHTSQACPNGTYSIGPPSLATITKALKDPRKVMPPQVGYSTPS
jgi:hypothetical protein